MIKFAASYLKALASLMLTMMVYCMTVVPMIEPGPKEEQPIPPYDQALGGERWWQDFFPPDAWQVNEPRVINTDRGILLSSSWTQIDATTWELKPLTIILPHSREARRAIQDKQTSELIREEMWLISAEEGAEIHFQKPLEITSGELPSVIRGELRGAIEITRRAAAGAGEKPWSIRTYDVSIERRLLSTQREVRIDWNDSLIQGRNMRIMLRGGGLLSDGPVTASAWGPLDELELFNVDKVDIALPPGGIWADVQSRRFTEEPHLKSLPARLQAACGGRFAFDFKTSQARMQNGVKLTHQLGDLPPDEFFGEEVAFVLEPPLEKIPGDSTRELSGIKLRSFEAIGVDSLQDFVGEKWVEFHAPTIGATARAKHVKVDLERQRIELDGRINRPDTTQSIVVLNYEGTEFRAPRIEYQAAPAGAPESRHLGWMLASGPGEIAATAASQTGEAQARWQTSFKMSPSPESEQNQWLELVGNVLVESKQHGFLASERLEVWLKKRDQASNAQPQSSLPDNELSSRYVPDRVFATGNAILANGDIRAQVPELDLTLVHVPATPVGAAHAPSDSLPLSDSAGNPMYQWVTPPSTPEPRGPTELGGQSPPATSSTSLPNSIPPQPGSAESPPVGATRTSNRVVVDDVAHTHDRRSPPGKRLAQSNQKPILQTQPAEIRVPISVTGSKLQARVISSGSDAWVDQLQISGPVRLWRDAPPAVNGSSRTARANLPWHIEGDRLLMTTNRAGEADVQIEGQPAKVIVAEGSLESETIRFDQARNLVWINQPGEFTIPLSVLNAQNGSQASSQIEWFDPPHCTWRGKMIFDGRMVAIQGDIEFDGGLRSAPNRFWWIKGSSQRLNATLVEPLNMRTANTAKVEVGQIQLSDNVEIRASQVERTAGDVRPLSREQIVVTLLTFHVAENKLIGSGPGWVRSYHGSQGQVGQLTAAGPAVSPTELQGIHLKFRDSLVGFLDRSEVIFDGKVELGVSPLTSWDDSIDVDQMQTLQLDQMFLSCDQLKAYDTSRVLAGSAAAAPKEAWEFKATGNVAFDGKADMGNYHGSGYQLTYMQAKERLVLRGDGRRSAELRRIPLPGSTTTFRGETVLNFKEAYVNPKTLEVQNLQLSEGGIQWLRDAPAGNPSVPFPNTTKAAGQALPDPRQDFYKRNRR